MRLSDYAEPVVVERFHDRELSGRNRALKLLRRAISQVLGVFGLAMLLIPLQVIGLVTLDLPLHLFDGFAPSEGLAASRWMSRGEGLLILVLLASIMMTRRWGSPYVARVILMAWAVTLIFLTMLIVDLAPSLEPGDFPSARFLMALIGSWVFGELVAITVYDLTRGGTWWRAPFFGAAFGFAAQAFVYFPWSFASTGAPWVWWMAISLILSTVISAVFVVFYGAVRGLIAPKLGLGGR